MLSGIPSWDSCRSLRTGSDLFDRYLDSSYYYTIEAETKQCRKPSGTRPRISSSFAVVRSPNNTTTNSISLSIGRSVIFPFSFSSGSFDFRIVAIFFPIRAITVRIFFTSQLFSGKRKTRAGESNTDAREPFETRCFADLLLYSQLKHQNLNACFHERRP